MNRVASRAALLLVVAAQGAALAQAPPDAGRTLRSIERSTGRNKPAPAPRSPRAEAPLPGGDGQTLVVTAFRLSGSHFSVEEMQTVFAPCTGKALTLAQIEEGARKVGDFHRRHGLAVQTRLPAQTVRSGVVEIIVVDGSQGHLAIPPSTRAGSRPTGSESRDAAA